MGVPPRWLVIGLGAATFLAAAKSHGRQLRLERELAGYWEVVFGGHNPAFVEALWRRDRVWFWSLAAAVALGTLGFRMLAARYAWPLPVEGEPTGRSIPGMILLHVLFPLTVAFVVNGLASLWRFSVAAPSAATGGAHPQGWLSQAAWGSAGWWLLTLALVAALALGVWRRAA